MHYPTAQFYTHVTSLKYTKNTARSTAQTWKSETYLSISADFDWFVVVPRVLEVHTHRKLQATSVEGIENRGEDEVCSLWINTQVGAQH
jgi:hypothetical protein